MFFSRRFLAICLLLVFIISATIFSLGLGRIKDIFIESPLANFYVENFRDKEMFDSDHVVTTLDNGMSIIVNIHDKTVCWFVRIAGHWDSNETRVLKKIINPGDKIIELGANFGAHTLKMAEMVGEKGKVYAFEANPNVSKYLKKSVELNNLDSIVTVVAKAAGEKPAQLFIRYDLANIGGGFLSSNDYGQSVMTEVVKVEDVIDQHTINLLKMDIEGFEFYALKGSKAIVDNNLDGIIIMMEWVQSHLKNQKTEPQEIVDFMKARDFKVWKVGRKSDGEKELVAISYEDLISLQVGDVLFSRKNLDLL